LAILSTSASIATPGLPVGSIQAFAGANAPTGWLICDASAVRRQDYPDLFNTIGTTYGSGDGSTTFNLPDLRGRMPVGAGNDGTAANNASRTRGDKGGDTRLQSHIHNYGEVTTSGGAVNAGGDIIWAVSGGNVVDKAGAGYLKTKGTGSGSGENMPPFLVTNYIIKAVADIARGGWYTQSSPPVVTQLPTNPAIGEEVYLYASTGGVLNKRWDGTRWQSVSSGWQKIGDFTLSGTTLSYSSIPQTYTHLQVRFVMASSRSGFQNTGGRFRWNGITSGYSLGYRISVSTTVTNGATNATDTSAYLGQIPSGSRQTINCITRGIIDFPQYSQSYMVKTAHSTSAGWDGYSALSAVNTSVCSNDVAAITSITLLDDAGTNLTAESSAELWGCA
jgi:microcystin-dependent protein